MRITEEERNKGNVRSNNGKEFSKTNDRHQITDFRTSKTPSEINTRISSHRQTFHMAEKSQEKFWKKLGKGE